MKDIAESFGQLVDEQVRNNPAAARRLLLAGFRAFCVKLDVFPDRRLPRSRQYLARVLNHTITDLLTHPDKAALVSLFTPCELMQTLRIRSLCAEFYSAFVCGAHAQRAFVEAAHQEGIAETFCSYHKILLGSMYAGVFPKPGFIVNTSLACDANNLTFRAAADHFGVDRFYIDVPPFGGEESVAYVASSLRELSHFLEDQTHQKIEIARLAQTVARSGRTLQMLQKSGPLRGKRTLAGDIASQMYEIYFTHVGLGLPEAEKYARMLLADLEKAPGKKGVRILWIHTIPNWQIPVREMFNFSERATLIWCDMNFDSPVEMDPERPYESMARRLVENHFNGSGERRIESCVRMCRLLEADGAVIFCHWGCKQTAGISASMRDALAENGFPALILNGDGCDEDNASDGQVSTRLGAFIEMLEERGQ